jgi:hypothetical protein
MKGVEGVHATHQVAQRQPDDLTGAHGEPRQAQ